jgi:hypothetical protein
MDLVCCLPVCSYVCMYLCTYVCTVYWWMDVHLVISRKTGRSLFNSIFWSSSFRDRFPVNVNVPPPKLQTIQMGPETQTDVQNYWVFGLCPSSGILEERKHNPVIMSVIHHRQNNLESTNWRASEKKKAITILIKFKEFRETLSLYKTEYAVWSGIRC